MVDVEQLVDPELEGLLRELGSRPRSVFLRTSRKEAMRVLRSRTTQGVGAMAVPDALERELVTVHRDELAEILKEACRTRLLEGEREKLFMVPYTGVGTHHEIVPIQDLEARIERCVQLGAPGAVAAQADVICGVLASRPPERVSVLDLAALGQRIQPCDTWRLMSAISFISNKMAESAHSLAALVMDGWPSPDDALRALELLALSEVVEGRPLPGVEYQEQACSIRGDYPLGLLNLFRYSLLALKEAKAVEVAGRLDSMMKLDHPLISHSCEVTLVRKRSGDWQPSAASVQLALRLEPRLGDVAREVSRVFH